MLLLQFAVCKPQVVILHFANILAMAWFPGSKIMPWHLQLYMLEHAFELEAVTVTVHSNMFRVGEWIWKLEGHESVGSVVLCLFAP